MPNLKAGDAVLRFPPLLMYQGLRRVERSGSPISLTPREFDLLWFLASRYGAVVHRAELLRSVWGYAPGQDQRTLHTHINRLRAKLEGERSQYIQTVWGIGYKFEVCDSR